MKNFLLAIQAGGQYFRIVEDESVSFSEIIDDILEQTVLDFSRLFVKDHQAAFVTPPEGLLCDPVLGKDELELGKFHIWL